MKTNHMTPAFFAAACLTLIACQAMPAAPRPQMRIRAPAQGATVAGPKVKLEADVTNWTFVDANQPRQDGQGHLHFFIDVPASSIPVDAIVPLDQPAKYVHAGKAPYNAREIDLVPGAHTITIVMASNEHTVLADPAPVSVTFTVK